MAYSKILDKVSMELNQQIGIDIKGKAIMKKKSFTGLKKNLTSEQVGLVSTAITSVLAGANKETAQIERSKIANS